MEYNWAIVRKKTNLTKERVKTDPKFEGSRGASSEFGRASSAGALLRQAFAPAADHAKDHSTHHRLNKCFRRVMDTDTTNDHGKRQVINGDLLIIKGFEFNEINTLSGVFQIRCQALIDNKTGRMEVVVPGFATIKLSDEMKGVTHFRLKVAGVCLDLPEKRYKVDTEASEYLPIAAEWTEGQHFDLKVKKETGNLLFLGLGIEFYDRVNRKYYPMRNNGCFCVIDAAKAVTSGG